MRFPKALLAIPVAVLTACGVSLIPAITPARAADAFPVLAACPTITLGTDRLVLALCTRITARLQCCI